MPAISRLVRCLLLLMAAALFAPLATAADNGSVGVVLLHGKWGAPERVIDGLAAELRRKGFRVVTPEMPWSGRRLYDKSAEEAMAEIEAGITALRANGAKRIVLAGHSLGAAAALAYASRHALDAVVAIAPGHIPEGKRVRSLLAGSVTKAKEMVAAGKGDETEVFEDINTGDRHRSLKTSARAYLSYFDPDGPMRFSRNTADVKGNAPVLWIVPAGEEQPLRNAVMSFYQRLPANPATRLYEPPGTHIAAPGNASAEIAGWIETVVAAPAAR